MFGPSTGPLRCFRRCEGRARRADLVFTMLSGVPMVVEATAVVCFESASLKDRPSAGRYVRGVLELRKNHLHLARYGTESLPVSLADGSPAPARRSRGGWTARCPPRSQGTPG